MAVVAIFLESIATLLHSLIFIYILVVVAGAVLSWVSPDPYNPLVQIIRRLTEPVYGYIRYYLPTNFNGIDFAPILLLLVLQFLDLFLVRVLHHFATSLSQ
jgi:YggT family protein